MMMMMMKPSDFLKVTYVILTVGCWVVEFYGISTFVGYLMPNPFYTNNQFYFKHFSLA